MSRFPAVVLALAVGAGAAADMLNLKTGKLLKGTLRELTFSAAGVQTEHQRDELERIELSREGDKLALDQQVAVEGRVLAVTFDTPDGLHIIARDQLTGIVLDDSTTLGMLGEDKRPKTLVIEKQPAAETEQDDGELSDEQRAALKLNIQLYKQYLARAEKQEDDDQAAVKDKYVPQVKQVLGQIAALQRQIAEKERRRRGARLRDALYRQHDRKDNKNLKYRNDNRGNEYDRLVRSDGLDKDRRELKDAWAKAAKLRDTVRPLLRGIDDRCDALKERIRDVARLIRSSILDGDIPPRDQMVKGYEGALNNPKPKKPRGKR